MYKDKESFEIFKTSNQKKYLITECNYCDSDGCKIRENNPKKSIEVDGDMQDYKMEVLNKNERKIISKRDSFICNFSKDGKGEFYCKAEENSFSEFAGMKMYYFQRDIFELKDMRLITKFYFKNSGGVVDSTETCELRSY
jgi:hypothetical protein